MCAIFIKWYLSWTVHLFQLWLRLPCQTITRLCPRRNPKVDYRSASPTDLCKILERIQKVPQKGAWQAKKGKKPRFQHCVLTSPFYPRAEVEGFSFCFVVNLLFLFLFLTFYKLKSRFEKSWLIWFFSESTCSGLSKISNLFFCAHFRVTRPSAWCGHTVL
jgi:hypothetical protein